MTDTLRECKCGHYEISHDDLGCFDRVYSYNDDDMGACDCVLFEVNDD